MEQHGGTCSVDYHYNAGTVKAAAASFYEQYRRPAVITDQLISRESYPQQVAATVHQRHGFAYHHSFYQHHHHHHLRRQHQQPQNEAQKSDVTMSYSDAVTSFTELQPAPVSRRSAAAAVQSPAANTDWTSTSLPFAHQLSCE